MTGRGSCRRRTRDTTGGRSGSFCSSFISWYDPADQKARPIAELVKELEAERLVVRFDGELMPATAVGIAAAWAGYRRG